MRFIARVLPLALPALVAACAPIVVIDGDPGDPAAVDGGPAGEIEGACLAACTQRRIACSEPVTGCTVDCDKYTAVAATSDACAVAVSAIIVCMNEPAVGPACQSKCPDSATPFAACYVAWCTAAPAACQVGFGSGGSSP